MNECMKTNSLYKRGNKRWQNNKRVYEEFSVNIVNVCYIYRLSYAFRSVRCGLHRLAGAACRMFVSGKSAGKYSHIRLYNC